jgi:hypothetical protein
MAVLWNGGRRRGHLTQAGQLGVHAPKSWARESVVSTGCSNVSGLPFKNPLCGTHNVKPEMQARKGSTIIQRTESRRPDSETHTITRKEALLQNAAGYKDAPSTEGSLALTCTRFQPWRDSAMMEVTDGQTPPNTIRWFGPYFIAS